MYKASDMDNPSHVLYKYSNGERSRLVVILVNLVDRWSSF